MIATVEEDPHSTSDTLPLGETEEPGSETSKKQRSTFYWILLGLVVLHVVFFTGTVASCRAFYDEAYNDQSGFAYGYRGFIHNVTQQCTSWDEFDGWNEAWIIRVQNLMYMGIAGVVLIVFALMVWIMEGMYKLGGGTTDTSPTRFLCHCLLRPNIFAAMMITFGLLAFLTLMGKCSNIPPLDPGGLGCDFAIWSSLGMFACITSCIMGCSLCCCYHRQ